MTTDLYLKQFVTLKYHNEFLIYLYDTTKHGPIFIDLADTLHTRSGKASVVQYKHMLVEVSLHTAKLKLFGL